MCEREERSVEVIKKGGTATSLSLSVEIGSGFWGLARMQCTSGVTHHTFFFSLSLSEEVVSDCYEEGIKNGKDGGFLAEKDGV